MFEILAALLLLGALVAWLVSALRSEPGLGWFCFQHDIPDSERARSLVRAYLLRTRVWRVVGAAAGFVVPGALLLFTDVHLPLIVSLCVGWIAAGVIAELTGRRRRRFGTLVASPWPVTDLVSPAARHTVMVTAALGAASIGLAVASRATAAPGRLVVVSTVSLALAVIAWQGVHSIGRAPVPLAANDLDIADHAIRVASAVRVIAGWSALQLVFSGWLSWQTSQTTSGGISWVSTALTIGCFVGAVMAWYWMPIRLVHRRARGHALV